MRDKRAHVNLRNPDAYEPVEVTIEFTPHGSTTPTASEYVIAEGESQQEGEVALSGKQSYISKRLYVDFTPHENQAITDVGILVKEKQNESRVLYQDSPVIQADQIFYINIRADLVPKVGIANIEDGSPFP